MTQANSQVRYWHPDGRPTVEGEKLVLELSRRLDALEAKLTAIAAIAAPTGGATTDAEARTAIAAILAASG